MRRKKSKQENQEKKDLAAFKQGVKKLHKELDTPEKQLAYLAKLGVYTKTGRLTKNYR